MLLGSPLPATSDIWMNDSKMLEGEYDVAMNDKLIFFQIGDFTTRGMGNKFYTLKDVGGILGLSELLCDEPADR
jgi:hypothetical protein